MSDEVDTSRASVKTYLPAYQKAEWQRHADELDMSQSEFVRSMVQAGRRGFDPDDGRDPAEPGSDGPTPRGDVLETHVLELLESDVRTWDELLAALTDDIESRLEETLEGLQAANRIHHSPRKDGYELLGGDDGGD